MTYWCKNNVTFTGDEKAIADIIRYFMDIQQIKVQIDLHWRPPFVEQMTINQPSMQYHSRWLPNNQALYQVAERYHAGFTNRYHELNKGIVGEASFINENYTDIRLDGNDLAKLDYDAEKRIFVFNRPHEEELPALLDVLNLKKEMTKSITTPTSRGNYF